MSLRSVDEATWVAAGGTCLAVASSLVDLVIACKVSPYRVAPLAPPVPEGHPGGLYTGLNLRFLELKVPLFSPSRLGLTTYFKILLLESCMTFYFEIL